MKKKCKKNGKESLIYCYGYKHVKSPARQGTGPSLNFQALHNNIFQPTTFLHHLYHIQFFFFEIALFVAFRGHFFEAYFSPEKCAFKKLYKQRFFQIFSKTLGLSRICSEFSRIFQDFYNLHVNVEYLYCQRNDEVWMDIYMYKQYRYILQNNIRDNLQVPLKHI